MESYFDIYLGHGEQRTAFEVKDYDKPKENGCKFEIYRLGTLILSLMPEGDLFRTCSNPGNLDTNTIGQLIDQIEAHYL